MLSVKMMTLSLGSLTLELRNPEFGNKETIQSKRISRNIRGGDLVVFRDNNWSVTNILDFEITVLSQDRITEFLTFIRLTLGQPITLIDYMGRSWTGIIITPTEEAIQSGREFWKIKFQFQKV